MDRRYGSLVKNHSFKILYMILLIISGIAGKINAQIPAAQESWVTHYDGGNGTDSVSAMVTDNSGNIFVTGESKGSGTGFDYVTVKYNRNGDVVWSERYNGTANGNDIPRAIAIDGSGNVYVTGGSLNSSSDYDYLTIKYDPDGNVLWTQSYDGTGGSHDFATAIAVDGSGNVCVTGASRAGSNFNYDYLTVKYNSVGTELWTDRYDGTIPGDFTGEDIPLDLKLDASGNIYVTGSSALFFVGNAITIKYDSDGNRLWVKLFDGQNLDYHEATSIAVNLSGDVYITGETGLFGADAATIKYSSSGDQLWLRTYGSNGIELNEGLDILLDDSGYVYVTGIGFTDTTTKYDYLTLKYTPSGDLVWAKQYNGYGDGLDEAVSIAADDSFNVYVTGQSKNASGNYDFATLKYTSSGKEKWSVRYNGTGNGLDAARQVAVDDSDYIIVSGSSYSSGTGYDFVTIKYKQILIPIPAALQDEINSVKLLPLSPGNKNALISKLKNAIVKYNAGAYNTAKNILYAFINQLNQFVTDGLITQAQAQPLIDYALAIIDAINSLLPKIADNGTPELPSEFSLSQNYPNPFNPTTAIKYSIPKSGYVQLKVYDVLGKDVVSLVDGNREAGNYEVSFDGSKLASGLYIYRLTAGNYISTKKMLMIK